MTMSMAPDMTAWAAKWMACWADPHWRSTVVPGTVSGKPAARAALRPMFMACSPTVMVHPMTTSSTRAGSRSLRSTSALSGCGGEIDGVPARQLAVAAPHRGAHGVDDDGVGHGDPPGLPGPFVLSEVRASRPLRLLPNIWRCVRFVVPWTSASRRAGAVPRRGPVVAGGQRAPAANGTGPLPVARHRRGLRGPPGLGADHVRCPLVGRVVARGVRGPGLGLMEWLIFEEEYYRAGAPTRVGQNGIFLLAPTLFEFGTPEQKARYLPAMASGEEIWCQGWSEPDAGSDLAAIRSRAGAAPAPAPAPNTSPAPARHRPELGTETWVLNGQKTWCSRGCLRRLDLRALPLRPRGRAPPGTHLLPRAHGQSRA